MHNKAQENNTRYLLLKFDKSLKNHLSIINTSKNKILLKIMTDIEIIYTRSILRVIKLREKLITIEMGIEK